MAGIRAAVPRTFHRRHHARAAGRAHPGGRQGQPGRADVPAGASGAKSLRSLQTRIERGRHVSDHRCDVSRGEKGVGSLNRAQSLRKRLPTPFLASFSCLRVPLIELVVRSFCGRGIEDIFDSAETAVARRACRRNLWRVARRKLDQINRVRDLSELAVPPGNCLERLRGARNGQHSIRITDQYRICFR